MGGWVDGHFDIFLKPPQPFTGLFLTTTGVDVIARSVKEWELSQHSPITDDELTLEFMLELPDILFHSKNC